jgi:hypothetical protein
MHRRASCRVSACGEAFVTRQLWFTMLVAICSLLVLPAPALACTCVTGLPVCQQLWMGGDEYPSIVFEATVVAIEQELGPPLGPGGGRRPIRKVLLKDLKGWIGDPQTMITTEIAEETCGYHFEVGRRYLIDADRSPDTGGQRTSRCSLTQPVEQAADVLHYLDSLSRPSTGATVFGEVRLSSGSSRTGHSQRTPMTGVRIILNGPRSASTLTGPEGNFSFADVPPGAYQLTVEVEGRPELAVPEPQELRIPNAHACYKAWVNLAINGVVEGAVTDPAGAPLAGVVLNLSSADASPNSMPAFDIAISDDLGRFSFRELPPGPYRVGVNLMLGPRPDSPYPVAYALDPAGQPAVIELGLGALHQLRPIVISRLESTKAAGQVVWADGRPAAGCRVSAWPLVQPRPALGYGVFDTGPDGRFQLEVFKGLRYQFRADNCGTASLERVGGDGFVRLVLPHRQ